ncbi:mucin-5AC-like [Protopterus annectens]|uniref:mucin-5AC-like n=1 Tax=Protopterus annectens TaxID=7888 RepID=UPI001CFB6AC2|nr:mucin-5AC-like [Protopterus annectens]
MRHKSGHSAKCGQFRACGNPKYSSRIVGGASAQNGAWPWQVALLRNDYFICGGSLITENWIITAAHCYDESYGMDSYQILLGRYQLSVPSAGEIFTGVEQIIVHENYSRETVDNDIALMQLKQTIAFTKYILPICLPSSASQFPDDTMCWVTGWGDIKTEEQLSSPYTLQEVEVPIISRTTCDCLYHIGTTLNQNIQVIPQSSLCAGYTLGQKDSCQGDSGGPLACKKGSAWVLAGIVSFGEGCAEPNYPGVYTQVAVFQEWLQSKVHGLQFTDVNLTFPSVPGSSVCEYWNGIAVKLRENRGTQSTSTSPSTSSISSKTVPTGVSNATSISTTTTKPMSLITATTSTSNSMHTSRVTSITITTSSGTQYTGATSTAQTLRPTSSTKSTSVTSTTRPSSPNSNTKSTKATSTTHLPRPLSSTKGTSTKSTTHLPRPNSTTITTHVTSTTSPSSPTSNIKSTRTTTTAQTTRATSNSKSVSTISTTHSTRTMSNTITTSTSSTQYDKTARNINSNSIISTTHHPNPTSNAIATNVTSNADATSTTQTTNAISVTSDISTAHTLSVTINKSAARANSATHATYATTAMHTTSTFTVTSVTSTNTPSPSTAFYAAQTTGSNITTRRISTIHAISSATVTQKNTQSTKKGFYVNNHVKAGVQNSATAKTGCSFLISVAYIISSL